MRRDTDADSKVEGQVTNLAVTCEDDPMRRNELSHHGQQTTDRLTGWPADRLTG